VDLQWLVPLGGFLTTVVGAGIAWLVNRADKRKDAREAQVIQTLKDRVAELQAQLTALTKKLSRRTRAGDKWREQLIAHQIDPEPAEWPEDDDE